ncbi:MAG: GDP-L-fucose synthase [Bacteroidales bacterium]|nr:GDP-L-fucose synthase [Bacteroidales bacterium]MDZ4205255.1 GDP-L-fucose synthase [Bacteroidales bacterium]
MNKNSKIYIAGHQGMVGSALWKSLSAKGYRNLIGRAYSELDLTDQAATALFFETEKPDFVFMAAAKVGGIMANNTYRAEFIYSNLMIQSNIIHQAFLNGVKKLLFLGSTCIYPRNCPQPMKEEYLLTSPLEYTNEPYAIAKIAGIKMCESYNIQYGTNFLSVMPTNLYGPNENYDLEKSHVLPALLRKIHLGKCLKENNWKAIHDDLNKRPIEGMNGACQEAEIINILHKYGVKHLSPTSKPETIVEIWGSGKAMREFMWSEDMADACVFIMENINFSDLILPTPDIRNTHINIGSGKEISIRDLAYLVKKIVGFNGELYFNTEKPDGTLRKLTDPSKLHNLGWKHKIEIGEGIRKMYDWYQTN